MSSVSIYMTDTLLRIRLRDYVSNTSQWYGFWVPVDYIDFVSQELSCHPYLHDIEDVVDEDGWMYYGDGDLGYMQAKDLPALHDFIMSERYEHKF